MNVTIAVPSKNRPYGSTFKLLESANANIVVYVDESEADKYKKALPHHFKMRTHKLTTIGEIRNLINEENESNYLISLDDDINSISVSINELINQVINIKSDILLFSYAEIKANGEYLFMSKRYWLGGAYAIMPNVKVFMETRPYYNEDVDAFFRCLKRNLVITNLPITIEHNSGSVISNFTKAWRIIAFVNLYKVWGDKHEIMFDEKKKIYKGIFGMDKFQEEEIFYSEKGNKTIERLIEEYSENSEIVTQLKETLEYVKRGNIRPIPLWNEYKSITLSNGLEGAVISFEELYG